jgi:hypothetical protein
LAGLLDPEHGDLLAELLDQPLQGLVGPGGWRGPLGGVRRELGEADLGGVGDVPGHLQVGESVEGSTGAGRQPRGGQFAQARVDPGVPFRAGQGAVTRARGCGRPQEEQCHHQPRMEWPSLHRSTFPHPIGLRPVLDSQSSILSLVTEDSKPST